jgi:lysyl-tRNA synthetase class 2
MKNLDQGLSSRWPLLVDRAHMLAQVRAFFAARSVLEVDTPLLSRWTNVDANIDVIETSDLPGGKRFLHTSPEHCMKRLLAAGCGDIYQLSHVFRKGESGRRHNPEFMMIEWYRKSLSFEELMAETCALAELFLGGKPRETLSYRDAFKSYVGLDPFLCSNQELITQLTRINYGGALPETRDEMLNLLIGTLIEPHLGQQKLTVLTDYPASQAALACCKEKEGVLVAERFEIYYEGFELANGYHELADATQLRKRFEEGNQERVRQGKEALPIDEPFLAATENGFPACCGVAVGFDRLLMLRHSVTDIDYVLPFSWDRV